MITTLAKEMAMKLLKSSNAPWQMDIKVIEQIIQEAIDAGKSQALEGVTDGDLKEIKQLCETDPSGDGLIGHQYVLPLLAEVQKLLVEKEQWESKWNSIGEANAAGYNEAKEKFEGEVQKSRDEIKRLAAIVAKLHNNLTKASYEVLDLILKETNTTIEEAEIAGCTPFEMLRKMIKERNHLRQIVAKLPKTADGVPVVPGTNQNVWHIAKHSRNGAIKGRAEESMNWKGWAATFFSDMEEDGYLPGREIRDCYSTREAALAASSPTKGGS